MNERNLKETRRTPPPLTSTTRRDPLGHVTPMIDRARKSRFQSRKSSVPKFSPWRRGQIGGRSAAVPPRRHHAAHFMLIPPPPTKANVMTHNCLFDSAGVGAPFQPGICRRAEDVKRRGVPVGTTDPFRRGAASSEEASGAPKTCV